LDIVIDLAGHTRGGRIELFARRLAPIQLSYLGYPITTGLAEMDYRLTDSIADPPGEETSGYVETLVRMPNCFCCFSPPENAPAVGPLPAERNGFITFGSLHAMAKVNERVIELWAKVLAAVPGSQLLMVRNTLTRSTQERLLGLFSSHGIDPARITFNRQIKPSGGHLTFYNQIDASLDTFPFTGHTTACQSLFMGVPIVTLAGHSHRGRLVASVLTHVGHPEWIARSAEEFVNIAVNLATNLPALAEYRENLRQELAASPLCDGKQFTREFERTLTGITRQKLENPAPRP
jgi:protein O-GlcNAc transferase